MKGDEVRFVADVKRAFMRQGPPASTRRKVAASMCLTRALAPRLVRARAIRVCREGEHPIAGSSIDAQAYAAWPHLLVSPTGAGASRLDEALADRGLARTVTCHTPTFLMVPLIVASTDLVLTAPEAAVMPFAEPFGLRIFPPPVLLSPLRLVMIWPRRRERDEAHRWFRRLLMGLA